MALSEPVRKQISELLASERVVLFMKGSRQMPQCGFSAQVVQILDEHLSSYETVDVLRSPELRDGIKEFSQWPTIPQLFVSGQLIGGCDIVREMNSSGELQKLLGAETAAPKVPVITVSPAAVQAFQAALADARGDVLRFQIDAGFQNELFLAPRAPGDIEVQSNGLSLMLDARSARRADGVSIDFVDGPGGGFKILNPNEPPRVKELSAVEAKNRLDRGELALFDVRPESERAIASIAAARALDPAGQEFLMQLDRNTPVVFHCHHGIRSQAFAEQMLSQGFKNVYNLEGGIDAWSLQVDPAVPRY
jgi:monothiol glutaredoxin